MKFIFTFFLITFWARLISTPAAPKIIIWDVGQGSWTSWLNDKICVHIDAGGSKTDFYPKACLKKQNIFYFTHYDLDHINLSYSLLRRFREACRMQMIPQSVGFKKRKKLELLPLCSIKNMPQVQQIYFSQFKKENESHAFLLANKLLITGDSSKAIEKKWLFVDEIIQTSFILAGHHGSRTSLSIELLKRATRAQMIFVSCLQKKYGHPHPETIHKAAQFKLPLITTEKFGSVAIEVP